MKITHVDPVLVETPESPVLVETPEPEPVQSAPEPVETPEARAERQAADDAAIAGTKALLAELQVRLETVESELTQYRQSAGEQFSGDPAGLADWLATTEQHRAEAAKLATESESLRRQCAVAAQLLGKLELERAEADSARVQAIGRKMLAAALERYAKTAVELGDALLDVGAASIAANASSSFTANVRAMLLPDMPAMGKLLPDLPGFRRQREGQAVATGDPAFSQRMNELLRSAS